MTPFDIASRFIGIDEIAGSLDNELILRMLQLDQSWPDSDEVPWCSGFVNYVCYLWSEIHPLQPEIPRSKDLRARSWLPMGHPISLDYARPGFDIVVLQRGQGSQPGPDVLDAPGHVGFYAGHDDRYIHVLGGNQSDTVRVSNYAANRLLRVCRLQE